jgi:hypothetical protein
MSIEETVNLFIFIFMKFSSSKFQLTFQQLLQRLTGEVLLEDSHEEIPPTTNKTLLML